MPKDFEKCVSDGGRVFTKSLKNGQYIHICIDKKGKSHPGEVKKKKEKSLFCKAKEAVSKIRYVLNLLK